jgi:hypothetical protein
VLIDVADASARLCCGRCGVVPDSEDTEWDGSGLGIDIRRWASDGWDGAGRGKDGRRLARDGTGWDPATRRAAGSCWSLRCGSVV